MIECWDGHDEVSYEGDSGTQCPACMAIIEKQEEINAINKESKELKQAVRGLVRMIGSIDKKEDTPDYRETVVVKRIIREAEAQEGGAHDNR